MDDPGAGQRMKPKFNTLHYLIHAPNFLRLFWRLLTDRRVSPLAKLVMALGVAYFVFPLDLIPDFPLVGVGYLDDVIVLIVTARIFIKLCPRNVVAEHVQLIDDGG